MLVDRWWQDTYTFHFPVGEDTITLQDVIVLLELWIDGRAVISAVLQDVWATCHELFGLMCTGCNQVVTFVAPWEFRTDLHPMQLTMACICSRKLLFWRLESCCLRINQEIRFGFLITVVISRKLNLSRGVAASSHGYIVSYIMQHCPTVTRLLVPWFSYR